MDVPVRSRGTSRGAFTLVEVLLVLSLMAVVAAIAVPRYVASITHYRLGVAARRIAVDLAVARQRAKTTSASQAVVFNVAANRYEMPGVPPLPGTTGTYAVALGGDPYRVTLLSADFAGGSTVTFSAYGFPSSGGTVVVTAGDVTKTITLDPDTGRVSTP